MKKIIWVTLIILLTFLGFIWWYLYSALENIPPHFHANFALYINGERVDFSQDKYMEDIAGCSISGKIWARDRVHLHENNPDTIHVHHDGVTWGHFFANNNFTFWENFLSSDTGEVFVNSGERKLTFLLNGKEVSNPFNMLIHSEDRLLISYGLESSDELTERYENVSTNAGEYNAKYDPGSCWGTNENGILVALRDLYHSFHSDMNH